MKVLAVLLLALASASAGPVAAKLKPVHPRDRNIEQSIESRIVGGQTASEGQIPYQVGIVFKFGSSSGFCGGSILSPNWILTAAHCTSGATSATVYAGSTVLKSGVKLTVKKIVQHPQFNINTIQNDISLLELNKSLEFDDCIDKIGLPTTSNDDYTGQMATVSGWGQTQDIIPIQPVFLQFAKVEVISNIDCKNSYSIIIDSHICTNTKNGQGTCYGDSGGPLAINAESTERKQIGIVSFGSGNGCIAGPSAYTRVSSFTDWILTITGTVTNNINFK